MAKSTEAGLDKIIGQPSLISRRELQSKNCWFRVDAVPGCNSLADKMTEFKRRARLHQALWRISRDMPMGGHLRKGKRYPVGSRIDNEWEDTLKGANFLSKEILDAVRFRVAHPEPHQMLKEERLWTDLLSSMPLCFNLFGSLWGNLAEATVAVRSLEEDIPGKVTEVRFEWSPGRLDRSLLGNRSAFDVAFLLEIDNGTKGVVGIETKYHEHAKRERIPSPSRLPRYREVTLRSGMFNADWEDHVIGTDLQQIWLDHLLLLSMLQHPSNEFRWGRFVLVYPEGNVSYADAARRYSEVLVDRRTFSAKTLEDVLLVNSLPTELTNAFRERYLW